MLPTHPLVFLDERSDSERGLEVAACLASAGSGRAGAIEVLEPLAAWAAEGGLPDALALTDAVRAARADRLTALAAAWQTRGLALAPQIGWGVASIETIRAALRGGHDVVIKVARGQARFGWPLFGSVAQHLVRKCPLPVWLVAPERPLLPRRVLAVVRPEPGPPDLGSLDGRVLATARTVAEHCGAELHVVRPWSLAIGRLLPERGPSERTLGAMRAAAREAFEKLSSAAGIDPRRTLFLDGPPHEAVPHYAAATGVDLAVLGTAPSGSDAGLLIREDSEEILNRLACSVLALKPPDFATPIALDDA